MMYFSTEELELIQAALAEYNLFDRDADELDIKIQHELNQRNKSNDN